MVVRRQTCNWSFVTVSILVFLLVSIDTAFSSSAYSSNMNAELSTNSSNSSCSAYALDVVMNVSSTISGSDSNFGSGYWSWQMNYNASKTNKWIWNQVITATDSTFSIFSYALDASQTNVKSFNPPTQKYDWYLGTSGTLAEMYDTLDSNGNVNQITWAISYGGSLLVSTTLMLNSTYANEPIQYNNVQVGYSFASETNFSSGSGTFSYLPTPDILYLQQSCQNANNASWSLTAETSNMTYASSLRETCHRFPSYCIWHQSFDY